MKAQLKQQLLDHSEFIARLVSESNGSHQRIADHLKTITCGCPGKLRKLCKDEYPRATWGALGKEVEAFTRTNVFKMERLRQLTGRN